MEHIIKILKNHQQKMPLDILANKIGISDLQNFKHSINDLQELGKVVLSINNIVYMLGDKYEYGSLRLNPKGFGFIKNINDLEAEASFTPSISLANCFDGDTVVYQKTIEQDGRTKADVVELVTREKEFLIGEIQYSWNQKFLDFIPTEQAFSSFNFVIVNKEEFNFEVNQLIKAKLLRTNGKKAFVRLLKIIGNANKASDRIFSIAEEMNIKTEFDKKTLQNAKEVAIPIEYDSEFLRREKFSLEEKVVVTIDGADSKDLDDAICVEKLANNHFKLIVAIADVLHYVKVDSPLDKEALIRGNSTYLANKVIPMLPEVLSNDMCSLNPQTKKLAMVCEMEFNNQGHMLSKKVYESIIKTRQRLTYDEVNDFIENKTWTYDHELSMMMNNAIELYYLIDQVKINRGTITFDIREPKIIMDKDSNVIDIKARPTGEAEKLIEQFMVSANEAVAEIVFEKELPYIYRNHGKPEEEDLITWYASLKLYGIDPKLTPKEMLDPINISKALNQINSQIKDPSEVELLNLSLLRYMDKARYELENIGHFGLSSPCYTHFTSPIRRYSDLMVHRYLKQYIIKKSYTKQDLEVNKEFINRASHIINQTEVTSVDCEREVNKACMAEFMHDKIGHIYTGIISAALKFGIFVQLDNLVEGLVHIYNLETGIVYDEKRNILLKPDNTYYRMGQKVKIIVDNVDVKKRKVDFKLVK